MASIILIQTTQDYVDFIGNPSKADGWYGYPDSLYTVALTTHNFNGRIYIEASLATNPLVGDWFPIQLMPGLDYLQYPVIPGAPTGINGGDSGTQGFSFRGNYLYIRARIYRSYIFGESSPDQISGMGDVRIVLSQGQTTYSSSSTLPPVLGFTQIVNIGAGYQIYAGLNDFGIPQLRTLIAGTGITISQSATSLTINSLSGNGTITSTSGSFLNLSDTPANYVNKANAVVMVNPVANSLVFTLLPPVAYSGLLNDATGVLTSAKGGTGLGTIPAKSILYGSDAGEIALIVAPGVNDANKVLTWTGTTYAWLDASSTTAGSEIIVVNSNVATFSTPSLNFVGSGVSVTNQGGSAVVNIPGGSSTAVTTGVTVISSGSTYECTGFERYIIVRKAVGSTTQINLHVSPPVGAIITVKDGKGDVQAYPIIINFGVNYVDNYGTTLVRMTSPYSFFTIVFDGVKWNVVG